MKSLTKTLLCGSSAVVLSVAGVMGTMYSKDWVNDKIKQAVVKYGEEDKQKTKRWLEEYEKRDKEWTQDGFEVYEKLGKEWTEKELQEYEERDKKWTKDGFEARVPLELLIKAFDSTYKIVNKSFYETREGTIIDSQYTGLGSGILLEGGYLLTAKHVVEEDFPRTYSEYYWGRVGYHHNELSIDDRFKLKKILFGDGYDYALLKLEEGEPGIPFYRQGLNFPDLVEPGMRSAAIGYSLGSIKNIRLGNVSQIESDAGEEYLTFKNSIIPGDSGGPLFVIDDGEIKLTALTCLLSVMRDWNVEGVLHPTNIGYGLKLETILEDMENKLEDENLDEEIAKELRNFLDLNRSAY